MADEREIYLELIERWGLDYLARYASSAENLRRVLQRRIRRRCPNSHQALQQGLPLIEAVVERYSRSGLIDDAAYALSRADTFHRRGESIMKIRARLISKGVPDAIATEALAILQAEATDPDLAAGVAFARRRRLGPYREGDRAPEREFALFARAGFSRRIAERVLACKDIESAERLAHDART